MPLHPATRMARPRYSRRSTIYGLQPRQRYGPQDRWFPFP
jgi:hypothetical protein